MRNFLHGRWRLWPLAIFFVSASGVWLTTGRPSAPPAAEPSVSAEKKPLQLNDEDMRRAGLIVRPIAPAQSTDTLELFGAVEPNRDRLVRITTPVAGRLARVDASLGDRVTAGQTLALLESPEGGDAQAAYQQAETALALAARDRDRIRALVKGGSLAAKEGLRADAEFDKARAQRDAAAAKLKALGLTQKAGDPGRLPVTAPLAGVITEKTAVTGEHVQAGQALFTAADLTSLWIEADLFERDLGRVAVGADAKVTVTAFPDRQFPGTVRYLSSGLDRETRTAKARIELDNSEGLLKPGMFATVHLTLPGQKPVLRVPENALLLLQGQMTGFVKTRDGFEPRPVEVGARSAGEIIVTSGLEAGDELVISGAYALKARLLKSQIGDAD